MTKYLTKSNSQDLKYIDITITVNGNTNRMSQVPFDMVTKSVTPVTFSNCSDFPKSVLRVIAGAFFKVSNTTD